MASKRRRATKNEKRRRLQMVAEWIEYDGLEFREAVPLIVEEFGVGHRQAVRYFVEARELTLGVSYQDYYGRMARGQHGQFSARLL